MVLSLSHKLSTNIPYCNGLAKPGQEQLYDVSPADVRNSFYLQTSNHSGTPGQLITAVTMDFISLAALRHMEEGADPRRVFSGCAGYSDRKVMLIEDAQLPSDMVTPDRVIVASWFPEGLDTGPCTVIAGSTAQRG